MGRTDNPAGVLLPDPATARRIHLAGQAVAYTLRRARRRSIGFTVGPQGLRVAAPHRTSLGDIEAALEAKSAWIVRKLAEQRERTERQKATRIDWRDGATLPFLGSMLRVVLDAGGEGAVLVDAGSEEHSSAPVRVLRVGLPPSATPSQMRDAVQRWLLAEARCLFARRTAHFAALLDVRMTRLSLTSARTRWGSASADGSVRLNWRLVRFGLPTIDYVVAHELAHLRHMNHGPAFWATVASVIPDVAQQRRTLKHEGLPAFD